MTHACRGCWHHDCGAVEDHEREWRSSESTWRLSTAQFYACPACGGDVRTDWCPARPTVTSLRRAA